MNSVLLTLPQNWCNSRDLKAKGKKACFESQFSSIILIMFLLYEKVPFRMKPLVIVHANAFVDFTAWIVLAPVHLVQPTV